MSRIAPSVRKAFLFALGLASFSTASAQTAPSARAPIDTSSCSRPVYPEEDARLKNTGTVTMNFLIGPDGRVLESKLVKSSGHRSLDEAARSALVKCRFKSPLTPEGQPVQAWTAVQYVWTPE